MEWMRLNKYNIKDNILYILNSIPVNSPSRWQYLQCFWQRTIHGISVGTWEEKLMDKTDEVSSKGKIVLLNETFVHWCGNWLEWTKWSRSQRARCRTQDISRRLQTTHYKSKISVLWYFSKPISKSISKCFTVSLSIVRHGLPDSRFYIFILIYKLDFT